MDGANIGVIGVIYYLCTKQGTIFSPFYVCLKTDVMKRVVFIMILSVVLSSCSTFNSAMIGDDLYTAHSRTEIAKRQMAEAEAARAEAEARQAAWEAKLAEARALAAENEFKGVTSNALVASSANPYDSVLADDYQSAYARRLYGFNSPSYRMPSSYYTYRYSDAYHYASAYDPAFYNIMVSGDQVWVEPKYITSMFGSWGASVVVPTYSWYYGWTRPSYMWWYGYPRYSWYDWCWGSCYDPYYGWSWGFGWGGYPYHPGYVPPHHHHHYYPPHYGGGSHRPNRPTVAHRPNNPSRPGGSPFYSGSSNSRPSTPAYSGGSSSGRNQYRNSGTVTGSGQYRGTSGRTPSSQYRSNSSTRSSSSFNQRNDNNSFRSSSSSSHSGGGYGGGYSGGSHSSGGSHGGGQGRR